MDGRNNIDPEWEKNKVVSKNGYTSFVFWETMKTGFLDLFTDKDQKAEMCFALIDYGLYGITPTFDNPLLNIAWQQIRQNMIGQMQHRKNSVEHGKKGGRPRSGEFIPPTPQEVKAYCTEKGLQSVDEQLFCSYYESNGWVLRNGGKMKDWRKAVNAWNALKYDTLS